MSAKFKTKTYTVAITRTSFATAQFEVEASNEEEAIEKSFEKAYNHEFSSCGADCEISYIEPKAEEK